jgi:ABC-type phosphate transport system substrate-binding protein
MKPLFHFVLLSALGLANLSLAHAELVVVVDAKSGIERLTRDEVINIFLGRHRKMPTGVAAIPIDQPAANPLRGEFYRKLVDKDLAEINAYWARLFFSGKTKPPLQAASAAEVIALVIDKPGGIGYVERARLDSRLRIVMDFAP